MLEARVAPYEPDDLELGDDRAAPVAPREIAPERDIGATAPEVAPLGHQSSGLV